MKFLPSTATLLQEVVERELPTTLVLTSSVNPSVEGEDVTLTATVTAGDEVVTGDVEFSVDGVVAGTAALNGDAVQIISDLMPGAHSIDAHYLGTP